MQLKTVLRAGLPLAACAAAFCATEVWNTKDSSIWTDTEANTILNNSPWAKQIKTKSTQSGGARRGGGRMGGGGMGRRGGMGYPGGGYPGGGGGGYPGGGGGGRGGADNQPMSALVRWESAKPVQEAEARLQKLNNSADSKPSDGSVETKPKANPFENHYVVSVIGLRAGGGRQGRNQDDDDDRGASSTMRNQLMSSTQLILKKRAPITPDNVKVKTEGGANEIQFFFPKTSTLSLEDKEVTFQSMVGRMKVENKFDLKKMTRNKKLELD